MDKVIKKTNGKPSHKRKLDYLWLTLLKSLDFIKQSLGCSLRPSYSGESGHCAPWRKSSLSTADLLILLSSTQRAKSWGVHQCTGVCNRNISLFPGGAMVMKPPANAGLGWGGSLEKKIATHHSILIGKFQGQRSLVGYSSWGFKELRQDWAHTDSYWSLTCHRVAIGICPRVPKTAAISRVL